MKLSKLAMLAAIACGINTGTAAEYRTSGISTAAYQGVGQTGVTPVGHCETCDQPACGCEESSCDPCCGAESACDAMCDEGCDSLLGGSGCSLTEKLKLAGWLQLGYHTGGNRFNGPGGPITSNFNDYPDGVRLHQAYLYLEEVADGSKGLGFGGRVDYVYGIDGPDTQAFGQVNGYDANWDNGGFYGHALPQLYGEVAYGDTSIKIGHFYTLIGYEVVPATGNFFYSHSFTMYNSEPFTHTGVLISEKLADDVTIYGGYVTGWDSGFDDNGDAFLGGVTFSPMDDVTFTYGTVMGRFNEGPGSIAFNERGYMHSMITNVKLTDDLTYVFWHDFLKTKDETGAVVRDTIDITQYLIYALNDKWSVGGRFEWWNVDGIAYPTAAGGGARVFGDNSDVYVLTTGLNYKPCDNFLIRPELRWNWDKDPMGVNDLDSAGNLQSSEAVFGIDAIVSF